jgi:hypothetical protein
MLLMSLVITQLGKTCQGCESSQVATSRLVDRLEQGYPDWVPLLPSGTFALPFPGETEGGAYVVAGLSLLSLTKCCYL